MRKTLAMLMLVGFWVQPAGAAEYLHPKLKAKEVSIRSLALLPVKIEVPEKWCEGLGKHDARIQKIVDGVASLVSKLLKGHGFTVLEDAFDGQGEGVTAEAATGERRSSLATLQTRFDSVAPQLRARPKDVTKGRFLLGDHVAGLVSEAADAFVVVRGRGIIATKGKAFLTGGLAGTAFAPKGTLECDVVIVDARSGEVLFFSRTTGRGDIVKAAGGQLEKPLLKSLKKLPVGS